MKRLTSRGISQVALYGTGELAEALFRLASKSGIRVAAVFGEQGGKRFFGLSVKAEEEALRYPFHILIATFKGVDGRMERLKKMGVKRERIVIL